MNPIPGKGSRHRAAPFFLLRLQSLRPESPLIIVIRILSRESASVRHRDHSLPLPRNAVLTRKALFTPGESAPGKPAFSPPPPETRMALKHHMQGVACIVQLPACVYPDSLHGLLRNSSLPSGRCGFPIFDSFILA